MGLALTASIIMLGAAALASVGLMVAPATSSGGASVSRTLTTSVVSVDGFTGTVVVFSPSMSAFSAAPGRSASVAASQPAGGDPSLAFSPLSGIVGSDVVLTGSGFAAGDPVTPYFNDTAYPCNEGTVKVTGAGSFTCTVTVPVSSAGPYVINASTPTNGKVTAPGTFAVLPALTFSPLSGDVGGTVTLTGSGFSSADSVVPIFGGTNLACNSGGAVGGDGSFSCPVTVPSVSPGPYSIAASTLDDGTILATGTFAVYSDPTVSIAPAGPLTYDVGQTASALTATVSYAGPNTASVEWYSSASSSCSASSTDTGTSGTTFTPSIASTGTRYYCAVVSDSGVSGYTWVSNAVMVTVNTALTAPGAPTPSASTLDADQALTVTGKIPSTGTAPYQYEWLFATASTYSKATVCGTPSGGGATAGAAETCSIAASTLTAGNTYTFELLVNDSASTPETQKSPPSASVAVNAALTAPVAPTPSASTLDANQALTVSGKVPSTGTALYQYEWLYSTGSTYSKATVCGTPSGSGVTAGAGETCSITASTLTGGQTYIFEFLVNDSASAPETQTSPASSAVTVNSALTAPVAPTPSASTLDADQALTVSGNVPSTGTAPYQYEWLYSTSSSYTKATVCGTPAGNGATAGAVETCSIAANTLTAANAYTFELLVNDSASTPVTQTSPASASVTVNSALTAPAAPTVSATALDANQPLTVMGKTPSTGTSPYAWQWLISINGAPYAEATECGASVSGSGAPKGATETCTIPGNTLTASTSYNFELQVTDSASTPETQTSSTSPTVTTTSALTAGTPVPASPTIDNGQSVTLTANPSGGSGGDTYQWYSGSSAGACTALGSPISGATSSAYLASPTSTTYYCYAVTDLNSVTATSNADEVTVNSALTAPAPPTVSASALDVDQRLTVTGTVPSTGTPSYSWQWLISVNGGAYASATQCVVNDGTGANGGVLELCGIAAGTLTVGDTYAFELEVTDSSATPMSQTSAASSTAKVGAALVPGTPTPASPIIDSGQTVTLTANPSGGSGGDTYRWYSGSSAGACTALGSPISGATSSTYLASPTNTTYYCYVVTDSATSPETQTSSASSAVTVSSALTLPGAPTPSVTALNADQTLNVTGKIPSTGTAPYSWQWLISVNGGAYAAATLCAVNGGTGASGGASETCRIAAGTLTAGATYAFELKVTDSATSPVTQTSTATSAVTVESTAPAAAPSSFPWLWVFVGTATAALVALFLVALFVSRRRRRPSSSPIQPWQEGLPTGAGAVPPGGPTSTPIETPGNLGPAPRVVSPAETGGAPAGTSAPAAAEPVPDIDVMMDQLDKISKGMKKAPKEGSAEAGEVAGEEADR